MTWSTCIGLCHFKWGLRLMHVPHVQQWCSLHLCSFCTPDGYIIVDKTNPIYQQATWLMATAVRCAYQTWILFRHTVSCHGGARWEVLKRQMASLWRTIFCVLQTFLAGWSPSTTRIYILPFWWKHFHLPLFNFHRSSLCIHCVGSWGENEIRLDNLTKILYINNISKVRLYEKLYKKGDQPRRN